MDSVQRLCIVHAPVVPAVRGDDVVAGVSELLAHEAPGDGLRLRIRLHANVQRQTVAGADVEGSVVDFCWADKTPFWNKKIGGVYNTGGKKYAPDFHLRENGWCKDFRERHVTSTQFV